MAKKASSAPAAAAAAAAAPSTENLVIEGLKNAIGPTAASSPVGPMYLEDVIIALQKTFSRVNEMTQSNRSSNTHRPTALISGPVQFTISAQVAPAKEYTQTLCVADGGPMTVMLQGTLNTDVKVHDAFATPRTAESSSADTSGTTTPSPQQHG